MKTYETVVVVVIKNENTGAGTNIRFFEKK